MNLQTFIKICIIFITINATNFVTSFEPEMFESLSDIYKTRLENAKKELSEIINLNNIYPKEFLNLLKKREAIIPFKVFYDYNSWINFHKKEKNIVLHNTENAISADPELYALFSIIKNDLGVIENVPLYIAKNNDPQLEINNFSASYNPRYNLIIINKNYKYWPIPVLMFVLIHELEHANQWNHHSHSFENFNNESLNLSRMEGKQSKTGWHLKKECAADAAAFGYFDCPKCLQNIQSYYSLKHDPQDLPAGYFTTEEGYFSAEDFKLYIEHTCLHGELCEAHKLKNKFNMRNFFRNQRTNDNYLKSLSFKYFLPRTESKK